MITLEPPRGLPESADAWSSLGLSRGGLGRFVRRARLIVGVRGEVDVLLSDDLALRRLNRRFRGKNKATDVISFPAPPEIAARHAGDLAISVETARRQAEEQGHSLRDEIRVLLLHGLLHLSGMDHETDKGEMAGREAELRKELRLPVGLIARAGKRRSPAGTSAARSRAARATAARSTATRPRAARLTAARATAARATAARSSAPPARPR